MNKIAIILYGISSYIVGLAGLTAFMLYLGDWNFLPFGINSSAHTVSVTFAIIVNLLIVLAFGLHHSVAARHSFKEWLNRVLPESIERSTYVLISGIFMFVFVLYWQPLAGTIWHSENTGIMYFLNVVHVLGWVVLVVATFEIDHFHLMGLKQSISMNTYEGGKLKENFLYRVVRHPIQTGVLLGIWSTAHMSATQFMLSMSFTIYIFIGLYFEEKSLVSHFGDAYLDYKKRVPALIPFWPK